MKNNNLGIALTKEVCVICLKEQDGSIIMNTKLTKKHADNIKKLDRKVIGFADKPCEECQKNIKKAFMFIGFDESKSNMNEFPNVYRTGHIIGLKKSANIVKEIKKNKPNIYKYGYTFMDSNAMKEYGLIK